MQCLEVSGAVRPLWVSLGVKGLSGYHVWILIRIPFADMQYTSFVSEPNACYFLFLCLVPHTGSLVYGHSFFTLGTLFSLERFSSLAEFVCLIWFHNASLIHSSSIHLYLLYTTPHSNCTCTITGNTQQWTLNIESQSAIVARVSWPTFLINSHEVDLLYVTNIKYGLKFTIFQWMCWNLSTDVSEILLAT